MKQIQISQLILPPAPSASKNFQDYQTSVQAWTRQAEQAIRQLLTYIQKINAQLPP